jgi:allophanate hydrolase
MTGSTIRISETQIRDDRHGGIKQPTFITTNDAVRVVRGPQDRFFSDTAIKSFFSAQYALTDSFDRMGVRLSGPKLEIDSALSIPSEPITRGSVQVAGDGIPTVLLADHQTTGGYPKMATVISNDVDKVSQMRANDRMRFVEILPNDAVQATRKSATDHALYLAEIAEPKGTLDQRLMRENLICGAIAGDPAL